MQPKSIEMWEFTRNTLIHIYILGRWHIFITLAINIRYAGVFFSCCTNKLNFFSDFLSHNHIIFVSLLNMNFFLFFSRFYIKTLLRFHIEFWVKLLDIDLIVFLLPTLFFHSFWLGTSVSVVVDGGGGGGDGKVSRNRASGFEVGCTPSPHLLQWADFGVEVLIFTFKRLKPLSFAICSMLDCSRSPRAHFAYCPYDLLCFSFI